MRKRLSGLIVTVGRRGSFLLFLSFLDFVYGFSLLTAANPTVSHAHLIPPVTVWGIAWIIVGVVCLIQSFATLDRLAFSLAVLIKFLWSMTMFLSWGFTNTNPHGWISASVFLAFGMLTSVVSFWPEQRRFKIEDR
jgi:hypothetical protein